MCAVQLYGMRDVVVVDDDDDDVDRCVHVAH